MQGGCSKCNKAWSWSRLKEASTNVCTECYKVLRELKDCASNLSCVSNSPKKSASSKSRTEEMMSKPLGSGSAPGQQPLRQNVGAMPPLKNVPCSKNPGHPRFLPVRRLTADSLPRDFRSPHLADIIRLKGEETVRLTVTWTSPDRPQGFGYEELKGTTTIRRGSGTAFVMNMGKTQRCPSTTCSRNLRPHQVSGVFKVVTAAHVVFDDTEAGNTTVDFFLDDERETGNVVIAQGVKITSVDVENNRSVMECITHDLQLYDKLQHFRERKDRLLSEIPTKQSLPSTANAGADAVSTGLAVSTDNYLTILISHPHGGTKHISFGELQKVTRSGSSVNVKDMPPLVRCTMNYSTPTCPGSGGGTVNVFNKLGQCVAFAPHFGVSESGTNKSGAGWIRESELTSATSLKK
ncbi:uncharacterized protein LOC101863302 isoform X2 [Aplysia californica]|uniref:Uncharacterized protein LOC101863302 isoform X2 n=2 Tax=Aplysia californica TaxID=6500 RepID=A0ABM0K6R5_APLCA|nr:uncharacterized protein LOC101863302 isoform X2 [Aplysia californica]